MNMSATATAEFFRMIGAIVQTVGLVYIAYLFKRASDDSRATKHEMLEIIRDLTRPK